MKRIDVFEDKTAKEDELFGLLDSTMLLTSRAIGVGFLYFPSHADLPTFIAGNCFLIKFGRLISNCA